MVASLQTFGSQLQWNPHVHALASDGRNLFREPQARPLVTRMEDELNRLLREHGCRRNPAWNANS